MMRFSRDSNKTRCYQKPGNYPKNDKGKTIRYKLAQNTSIWVFRDREDDNVIRFELRPRIYGQTGSYRFKANTGP